MDDYNKEMMQAIQQALTVASEGKPVAVDPDDAELMLAFVDDALDPEAAMDSRFDEVAE